jgi:hypothetical protein
MSNEFDPNAYLLPAFIWRDPPRPLVFLPRPLPDVLDGLFLLLELRPMDAPDPRFREAFTVRRFLFPPLSESSCYGVTCSYIIPEDPASP